MPSKPLILSMLAVLAVGGCSDATSPGVTGDVRGLVVVDGSGLAGVDVELSGPEHREATTDDSGRFEFSEVRPGAYVVSLTGAPDDASFAATSRTAVIERTSGGSVETVDFVGNYIRTSSISGRVLSRDRGMANVQVRIEGPDTVLTHTDGDGDFSAPGLRRGTYAVAISGYPSSVHFPATTLELEVAIGESVEVVFEGEPESTATVVISSITRRTPSGGDEQVDHDRVKGRIEVQLTVDTGEETPTSVDLLLGGELVGRQLFNPDGDVEAAVAQGITRLAAATFQLAFTVDTGELDPETGTPRFMNGQRSLVARLSTVEGGENVWTSAIPVTLRNDDTFVGTLLPERGPLADSEGDEWVGGDLRVRVVPVLYQQERAVTSVTVEIRRDGGGALRERSSGGEPPFVVVFPGDDEPDGTNVTGYQTPRGSTDLIRVRSARYADGGTLHVPEETVLVPEVRVDNVAPPEGDLSLPEQGAESDCCLGNWVGATFSFPGAFAGEPDEGVGEEGVVVHVGPAAMSNQEIVKRPVARTGGDLSGTATNSELRAVAVYSDGLGNERLVPLQPSDGNPGVNDLGGVFGVDLTDPTASFTSAALEDRAVNPPTGSVWELRGEDRDSGFSSLPARTSLRYLAPGVDGSAACPFPGTSSCPLAPDGLVRELPDTPEGYFVYRARLLDRAGNRTEALERATLRDETPPALQGLQRPATPPAGGIFTAQVSASDNVDLHRATAYLRFGASGGLTDVMLPFAPSDTLGRRFDGTPLASATAGWTLPTVASLERADADDSSAPSGIARELLALRAAVEDAARNESTTEAGISALDPSTPASFSVSARGADGVAAWDLRATGDRVCSLQESLPDGGVCPDGVATALGLVAEARGEGGTFPSPFDAVHFYAVVDGRARWLGKVELPTVVADGTGPEARVWAWELEWTPERDLPAGAHALFAVGVDEGGRALRSRDVAGVEVVGAN